MEKKLMVDRDALFFSFRYALGRSSYAPLVVTDNIKANIELINDGDILSYIREINECDCFSDKIDKEYWDRFKDYLENELKRREKK